MKLRAGLVAIFVSVFFALIVGAENLRLSWVASEGEKLIWQQGVDGTGPSGPVLSFKFVLPESYPVPSLNVISAEYLDLKEPPRDLIPCREPFSWGQRGIFKGNPYIELLVYPLQAGKSEETPQLLTSFEIEFPEISSFEPSDSAYTECSPVALSSTFINYWDICKYRRERISAESPSASTIPQASTPVYRVSVNQDGIVRMTKDYLDSLGVDLTAAAPSCFHLTSRGVEIPILISDADSDNVFESGDAIIFYGQKLNIRNRSVWNGGDFTDTNVYFLFGDGAAGLRMPNVDVSPVNPGFPSASTFVSSVSFEQNTQMSWAEHMRPNGELWFWAPGIYYYVGGGEKTRTISIDLPHPVSNTDSFTIILQEGGMNNVLHMLDASLNSGAYVSRTFSGNTVASLSYNFVQNQLLTGGANTFKLRIPSSQTVTDNQIPDMISVSYLRTTDVDGNSILIEDSGGNLKYTAGTAGYKFSAAPYIFDLSAADPATGLYLPKNAINAGYNSGIVTFDAVDQGTSRKFYLSPNTLLPSLPVEVVASRDLTGGEVSAGCEFLILTHPDFHPAGSTAWDNYLYEKEIQFSDSVRWVDIQEVYDNFSHGIFDPTAVRDFLTLAHNSWTIPPSYILLIGDGSFDYKNIMSDVTFKNWVPTMMIEDASDYVKQGWIASDSWFSDADGDGYPDAAVGRIPARDYGQLAGILNKIMAYGDQAASSPWRNTQLFVADTYDEPWEQEFETYNTYLKNTYAASPYLSSSVYYHDSKYGTGTDDDLCAQDIRGYWDDALLVHYAGHSGSTFWGYQNGIFSLSALRGGQSDLDLLPAVTIAPPAPVPLPFVVNSTCYTTGFAYQYSPALFEAVFNASDRGVIGVTGFTTLSYLSEQKQFATPFFDNLLGAMKERTAGDAVEYARFKLPSSNSRPILSLVLLGDPTLEFPLPTVPAPPDFTGTSGNQSAALSWNHPSPIPAKYNIFRSTDGGVTFYKLNVSDITYPTATYTDTGLINGQTYIYYAVAVDSAEFSSAPSQLASVVPMNTSPPAAPGGLKASDPGIGDTLNISWNANGESDLNGYKLYSGTLPGVYGAPQLYSKNTTAVQLQGLTEGVRYYFVVTATNTSGLESVFSSEVSAIPTSSPIAVKIPAMITDLMVTRSGSDLILNWSKPLTDVKGNSVTVASFDIYRITGIYNYNLETVSLASPNARHTVAAVDGVNAYNFTDTGAVTLADTVTYLVVARDPAGNRSPASHNSPSSILTLKVTKNSPASPTLINFDPVSTRIDGSSTGLIAGYKLYGFLPPMTSPKDHIAPSSPVLSVDLAPALPLSSCDGGTAVYCDSSTSPPLLYTVIAIDNRGNTSLY